MKFDVVFVTYNSKKWIEKNIESILKSDYDLKNNVSLYYYDNNSSDDTYEFLNKINDKYKSKFANIGIKKGNKNKGFGYGNNQAAKMGNGEYIFILNTDTEIKKDTFKKLEERINKLKDKYSIFELRQEPYEHPKYYDPYTGEVSWASGACVVFKRGVFERLNGFDKNLFMYCEDVELSWRARSFGYKIQYLYDVGIIHYSYTEPNQFKETAYIYGFINNLYIRCKYGSLKNSLKGMKLLLGAIIHNKAGHVYTEKQYKVVSKKILKSFFNMFFKYVGARIYKHTHHFNSSFKPKFINNLDYEAVKVNSFNENYGKSYKSNTLVSVIVRTCGRPNVLRETLVSLRNQSYKNIEVVIVEDGENKSEKIIKDEFSDLNIKYKATGKHVGRSKVGNIAMEIASGKYLNFLDDDDLFYYNHVESLLKEAETNNYDIVYDTAFETQIDVKTTNPYKYLVKNVAVIHKEIYTPEKLYCSNIFPIQTVMFKKDVYKKCGGFDEKMDALEDWDLWIRFSLKYNFHYLNDTTSLYRVPLHKDVSIKRQEFIDSYLNYILEKHKNSRFESTVTNFFITCNKK